MEEGAGARAEATPDLPVQAGTNQTGMRASNERLLLSLVRRSGALAKSDIARMTGLSAQTVSVIMRRLEADHLLKRGKPQRGRVGQPSVPLSLDPDGAYFIGVKVGRRSLDIVLIDFLGAIRHAVTIGHDYPRPAPVIERICAEVTACEALLGRRARRIAGLGVALPFALWDWATEISAPEAEMAAWRDTDLRGALAERLPYPVYLQNDATAACGAELVFGRDMALRDFVYIYVGTFVGGGLVLNGVLFAGRSGNAAALGSMPVPGPDGRVEQLIDQASLCVLERRIREAGGSTEAMMSADGWDRIGPTLDAWIAQAAGGLAHAVVAAAAVVEIEAAVIDGAFPPAVRQRLIEATAQRMAGIDTSGLAPPELRAGSIGPMARALGGASLPLVDRYLLDPGAVSSQEPPRAPGGSELPARR